MKFKGMIRGVRIRRHKRHQFGDGQRCYWCGCRVVYGGGLLPNAATREHYVPRSLRGGKGSHNIVVACRACNNTRAVDRDWVPYFLHGMRPLPPKQAEHLGNMGCKCQREHLAA